MGMTDQWNRTEIPGENRNKNIWFDQLIFNKSAKTIEWGKKYSFLSINTNDEFRPLTHTINKINSERIIGLNVRTEITR